MGKGKEFQFGDDARKKIFKGVEILNKATSTTMGPNGKLILSQNLNRQPIATKDGVSVAKKVSLKDEFENMGVQICRESAEKTNQLCGDGTTGSILLAKEIIAEGFRLVSAGHKPIILKRGIDWAVQKVVEELKKNSKTIKSSKEVAQVGTISANGDEEIGNLIAEAIEKVGNDGTIAIEEGKTVETKLETVQGYRTDKGYVVNHFVNNDRGECVLENPLILITDNHINNSAVILPLLEKVYKEYPGRSLFIMSDGLDGEALALLALNSIKGSLPACCVRNSGFGDRKTEIMFDIATLTGSTVCSDTLGYKLEKFDTVWLGSAKKVIITKNSTTIIEGAGKPKDIKNRADVIRGGIKQLTDEWDIEKQQDRLAKFVGGISVLKIGAASEAEMKEKKDRCEDALNATRSATEEGISPGGGVALLRMSKILDLVEVPPDLQYGAGIVKKALSAPIKQILSNAGLDPAEIVINVMANENINYGFNAATEQYEDLVETGVIDPTKVIRCSLQNAASVAGVLLLTEAMIIDEKDEQS